MISFSVQFARRRFAPAIALGFLLNAAQGVAAELDFRSTDAVAGGSSASTDYTVADTLGEATTGESTSSDYAVRTGFVETLNLAPIPVQDSLIAATTGGKIRLSDLLANDADPDGEPVSLVELSSASNEGGSIKTDDGWILYSPPMGWSGTDLIRYTVADTAGNHVAGSIVVQTATSGPAAPKTIVHIALESGGQRTVRFIGIAGRSYAIQTKNDLSDPTWTDVSTLVAAPNGLFDFTDAELPAPAQRFYRAIQR